MARPSTFRHKLLIASVLGMGLSSPVSATAPQLSFDPAPNQAGTEVTIVNMQAAIEVTATPPGVLDAVDQSNTTSLTQCLIAGDENIDVDKGGMTFYAGTTGNPVDMPPQSFVLSCDPVDGVATSATFSCSEKQGFNVPETDKYTWDVICPPGGAAVAEIDTNPASGITLTMSANQNTNATKPFTVSNIGTATLNISAASGLSAPFSLSAVPAPNTGAIAGGAAKVYTITCSGAEQGSFFGNLAIVSDDADEGNAVSFPVNCTISGPEFDASPAPGPIGMSTSQGSNISTQITVTNSGNADLTIGALTGLSGKLSANITGNTIAASNSATITIFCDASSLGSSGAQVLAFSTNDPDGGEGTINYPVSCNVSAASSSEFDPSIASPGPISLATTTAVAATPVVLTINNSGTSNLTLSIGAGLSAPLSSGLSSGSVVAGGSATITIGCTSASVQNSNQLLNITTNDSDESSVSYNVGCSITGGSVPEFASVPAAGGTIVFNPVQSVAQNKTLTLQNVGTATLNGISVTAQPGAPFQTVTVPASLSGGASNNVTITCNSATAGTFNRTLTIATGDADEPSNTYNLQCVVAQAAEFDSTPVAPGPVSITTDQGILGKASLTVRNLGTTTLNVTAIAVTPAATFSISPVAPNTIVANSSVVYSVRCQNAVAGDYVGTLTYTTNDPDDGEGTVVFNINCRVNALVPEFDSTPRAGTAFSFYTPPGTPFVVNVTIRNTGNATMGYSLGGLSGVFSSNPAIGGPYMLGIGASRVIAVTCSGANGTAVTQTLSITHNDVNESPASYKFTCTPDIRLSALPVLRALIGSPLVTEPGISLFLNGFE